MEIPLDNILKLWMELWFDENALSDEKLYPAEDNLKSANFMLILYFLKVSNFLYVFCWKSY